jgi:hypothetical protein
VSRENAFRLSDPSLVCVSGEPQQLRLLPVASRIGAGGGGLGVGVRSNPFECSSNGCKLQPSVQQTRFCYSR